MEKIVEFAKMIKKFRPDIKIMVGNIANPETYTSFGKKIIKSPSLIEINCPSPL